MRRSIFVITVLGALACNARNDGEGDGSGGGTGSSTGEGTTGTTASTTAGTTTPSGSESPSSDDASSTTTGTGATSGDPSTTLDGSTHTTSDGATTSVGEPEEHHLGYGTMSACDDPLWCAYNGDIHTPAGGPLEGQQCFVAPVDPPYELIGMHYSVASAHTELEGFELRVYAFDGDVPTELVETIELNATFASPMEHDFEFDAPIVIDSAGFCVGFATVEPGLASALGMAVDTDSTVGEVSFIRMEGMCEVPQWQDVIDSGLEPIGNWCIDATIRTIPM